MSQAGDRAFYLSCLPLTVPLYNAHSQWQPHRASHSPDSPLLGFWSNLALSRWLLALLLASRPSYSPGYQCSQSSPFKVKSCQRPDPFPSILLCPLYYGHTGPFSHSVLTTDPSHLVNSLLSDSCTGCFLSFPQVSVCGLTTETFPDYMTQNSIISTFCRPNV